MLHTRVPDIGARLLAQMVAFVQSLREQNLRKPPSMAESVDWARTLLLLHAAELNEDLVRDTLAVLLKRESDISEAQPQIAQLVKDARAVQADAS